jgi:NACHT domain
MKRLLGSRIGGGGRTRHTGALTLCLFIGTGLGALSLAYARHLGTASTLVAVLVGGGAPAGLYLAWATYRDANSSKVVNLRRVADQFAVVVREQWEGEAAARRLNDPYPLPVRWVAADPSLVDPWQDLKRLATSGAGYSPSRAAWATAPDELEGEGNQLADVLESVPTKRLVVLGEPGSGKTMLIVRLLLDLLERRRGGGAVPVIVSAASWDPAAHGLHEWLISKLSIDYPALTAPASPATGERSCLEALLGQHLIIVLLDGLDEIPDPLRGRAISRINDAARPGESLVVTSRTGPYRESVQASSAGAVTLRAAAGIELCPLDPLISVAYLQSDAGGVDGAARWAPVLSASGFDSPIAGALSNPLMVGLARVIYNPRPGEHLGDLPEPADLVGFGDRPAIESHLLDGFVPASYRAYWRADNKLARWRSKPVERWLMFLALHLDRSVNSTDFGWWELSRAMPRRLFAVTTGLVIALMCGLTGGIAVWASVPFNSAGLGLIFGAALGFSVGCLSAVMAWRQAVNDPRPSRGVRWRFIGGKLARRRAFGLLFGLSFGLLFGLSFGVAVGYSTYLVDVGDVFRLPASLAIGVGLGAIFAIIVGLAGVLAFSLEEVPLDISSEVAPRTTLVRDRRTILASGFGFGISTAIALSLALPLILGFVYGVAGNIPLGFKGMLSAGLYSARNYTEPNGEILKLRIAIAVALGIAGWLTFSLAASRSAWPRWLIARSWLALRGQLPWRLLAFLSDAHKRGIIRQQGAVYQFRHLELQHRLAVKATAAGTHLPATYSANHARSRSWIALLIAITSIAAVTAFSGTVISGWQSQPTAIPPFEEPTKAPPSETASQSVKTPAIFTCDSVPTTRPRYYRLACATGQQYLASLQWSEWTDSGASGEGELAADNCIPDCADGKFVNNPVLIGLSDPRISKHGIRYFSKMVISGPSIFSFSLDLGHFGANLY